MLYHVCCLTEKQPEPPVAVETNDIEMEDDDVLDLLADDDIEVKPADKIPTPPPEQPTSKTDDKMETEDKAEVLF